jgi:hypothetical protein
VRRHFGHGHAIDGQTINQLDSVFSLESDFTAELKQTTGA